MTDQDVIPFGRNQKLFVVNTSMLEDVGIVICVPEIDLKDFFEIYKSINVYGNKISSMEASIPANENEICLAFCNGQWHRAVVTKTSGNGKPECMLIDLWSSHLIDIENIKPMPEIFKDPLPLAHIYHVEGYDNNTDDKYKKFASEIIQEGKMVFLDEVLEQQDNAVIRINNLLRFANKMEEEKTATKHEQEKL